LEKTLSALSSRKIGLKMGELVKVFLLLENTFSPKNRFKHWQIGGDFFASN